MGVVYILLSCTVVLYYVLHCIHLFIAICIAQPCSKVASLVALQKYSPLDTCFIWSGEELVFPCRDILVCPLWGAGGSHYIICRKSLPLSAREVARYLSHLWWWRWANAFLVEAAFIRKSGPLLNLLWFLIGHPLDDRREQARSDSKRRFSYLLSSGILVPPRMELGVYSSKPAIWTKSRNKLGEVSIFSYGHNMISWNLSQSASRHRPQTVTVGKRVGKILNKSKSFK